MIEERQVQELIYRALDEVGQNFPLPANLEKSPQTVLFGPAGALDSMGVLSLIVCLEQKIQDEFGQTVALADERVMTQSVSPLRTVETLTRHIQRLVEAAANE